MYKVIWLVKFRTDLPREEVVHLRIREAPPVLGAAGRVAAEELVGVVHELHRRSHDQLEVAGVLAVREPGRGLERAQSKRSAGIVVAFSIVLILLLGYWLFLAGGRA